MLNNVFKLFDYDSVIVFPWSYLHVNIFRKGVRRFRGMEWDVAISWQLRGLRGNDGMYIALTVTGLRIATFNKMQQTAHRKRHVYP